MSDMRKTLLMFMMLVSLTVIAYAQAPGAVENPKEHSIFLKSGNINSAYPISGFPGLFYKQYHPVFEAGYRVLLTGFGESRSQIDASVSLGYFYHRFMQHGIPISLDLRYKYDPGMLLQPFVSLGGGYLLAIPVPGRLTLNDQGEYERVGGIGRHQGTFNAALGAEIRFSTFSMMLEYKMMFQTPFVRSYVPLLPYNLIQCGCIFPIKNSN
jgi:hypothetical protein